MFVYSRHVYCLLCFWRTFCLNPSHFTAKYYRMCSHLRHECCLQCCSILLASWGKNVSRYTTKLLSRNKFLSSCNKGGLFVCFVLIAPQILEASLAQPSPKARFRVGSACNSWVWVRLISTDNIGVHFWACSKFFQTVT